MLAVMMISMLAVFPLRPVRAIYSFHVIGFVRGQGAFAIPFHQFWCASFDSDFLLGFDLVLGFALTGVFELIATPPEYGFEDHRHLLESRGVIDAVSPANVSVADIIELSERAR